MGGNQSGVQIDDHLIAHRATNRPSTGPDPSTGSGPRGADRCDHRIDVATEGGDQSGHGGIGGHVTEHLRLGPRHRDVGGAVTAQRDRGRQINQNLGRIVGRPRRPPRRQRR